MYDKKWRFDGRGMKFKLDFFNDNGVFFYSVSYYIICGKNIIKYGRS